MLRFIFLLLSLPLLDFALLHQLILLHSIATHSSSTGLFGFGKHTWLLSAASVNTANSTRIDFLCKQHN